MFKSRDTYIVFVSLDSMHPSAVGKNCLKIFLAGMVNIALVKAGQQRNLLRFPPKVSNDWNAKTVDILITMSGSLVIMFLIRTLSSCSLGKTF